MCYEYSFRICINILPAFVLLGLISRINMRLGVPEFVFNSVSWKTADSIVI